MPSIPKPVIVLILIAALFFSFAPLTRAQETVDITPTQLSPSPTIVNTPAPVPVLQGVNPKEWNADKQSAFSLQALEYGLICEGIHIEGCPVKVYDESGKKTTLKIYSGPPSGGAIADLGNTIALLYTPPTSSVQYLASAINNFGFTSPAYAQTLSVPGSGSSIIQPVLGIWQVMRNIAYLVFIVVFLVVGIMIMLRQKISQQAVISAQQAIPSLIIGLILITFSYFIAALIVDLAFLGIPVVANIISSAGPNAFGPTPPELQQAARNASVFDLFRASMGHAWRPGDFWSATTGITSGSGIGTSILTGAITAILGAIVGTFIAPGVGTIIGLGVGALGPLGVAGAVVSLLVPLILMVAMFIQMFRLLFALIGTYIQILVAVITGPIVILVSSIPGRSNGVMGWIKSLLGNALVFPAVIAAFFFAGYILQIPIDNFNAAPPLFGNLNTNFLKLILAYGIILATPGIPDMVRGAFGIKPQQGGIAGAALAGFTAGIQGTQQVAGGVSSGTRMAYNANQLNGVINWASHNPRIPTWIRGRIPGPHP